MARKKDGHPKTLPQAALVEKYNNLALKHGPVAVKAQSLLDTEEED